MKILDRLPINDDPYRLNVDGEPLRRLRAIIKNNLKLVIDGKRKHVSLRSVFW